MFYRMVMGKSHLPLYLPSYRREKFPVRRRARSPPTRSMTAFAGGGKFGTPVKKRSRSISTINREVTDRTCLITTNTNLRSLSFGSNGNSPKVTVGNVVSSQKYLYVALGTSILLQVPYYLTVRKALVCVRIAPW